jgi:hypothetical protein
LSPLIETVDTQEFSLDILKYSFITQSDDLDQQAFVKKKMETIVPSLIVMFRNKSSLPLLEMLTDILGRLEHEVRLSFRALAFRPLFQDYFVSCEGLLVS